MIAQVRLMRPDGEAAALRHLWGLVLMDPAASRSPAARRQGAPSSPGDRLERSLERAARVIPPARLVTVLSRDAETAMGTPAALPGRRCVTPSARGSAPDVFLGALAILQRDPHAVVATLPADHLTEAGPCLMRHVHRAASAATLRPELPVLVAGYPGSPDPDAPWVEPGDTIEGLEAFGVREVQRFVIRASATERAAGLLGTVSVVVAARTLASLGRRYLPEVLECLEPLEDVIGRPEETLLREAVWESMPRASLYGDVLALVEPLAVVPMPDAITGARAVPMTDAIAS